MNLVSPLTDVIDASIKKKVVAQAIAALGVASIPVLGPVVTAMLSYVFDLALAWLLTETVIGAARLFVIAQVDWEIKSVEKATAQLNDVLDNPTKYAAEQQAEIEKGFDDAAVSLIRITNARVLI